MVRPTRRKSGQRQRRAPARYTPSNARATPRQPDSPPCQQTPGQAWRVTPGANNASSDRRPGRTIRDLERRLAELENTLASPRGPIATSPPISQDRPNGELTIGFLALPLHASVQRELMEKIGEGEFIDLADLNPARPLEPRRQDRASLSTIAWSRAYIRMMSVMLAQERADAQDLLIHMDNVLGLAQDKHQWDSYDADFRRQQVNAGYSFAHTRVELYAKAVTRANPFRQQLPQQMPGRRLANFTSSFQPGTCFRFHSPGQRCEVSNCQYAHKCPFCGARHPQYMCYRGKANQPQAKEPEKREEKTSK